MVGGVLGAIVQLSVYSFKATVGLGGGSHYSVINGDYYYSMIH